MALIGGAIPAAGQEVPPSNAAPSASVQVDSITVQGNQRIDASLIKVTSALRPGPLTALDVQSAIRRLMATGNYSDVRVYSRGDPATGVVLILDVTERPMIATIDIEGLTQVSPSTVRDTLDLTDNEPLDPALVVRTEQMIRDLLANKGFQTLSVDTTLTPVNDSTGAYRLTFNVREGNRLNIAEIDFEGNEHFDDAKLRDAISTKAEGFLWFHQGKYDEAKWEQDLRQKLPQFYGRNGFIDFAVVSDSIVVDPRSGKARLVVTVNEGPQYRLGDFSVEGASHFPSEQLEAIFTSERRTVLGLPFGGSDEREAGEVFNNAALTDAAQQIRTLYNNDGYLFAQVEPRIERVPAEAPGESPTVDVTLAVSEDVPFYIGKITIEGNTYTHESVIRNQLRVYPGDLYNEDRVIQSYQSIAALGFFETPLPAPVPNPHPEDGTVDITFTVKEKQTATINFGTAIGGGGYGRAGGVSGFLGFTQPNLFGMAKQASVRAEYGYGRSSFTASYTDPELFGTQNSASVSVFHTDDRFRGISFTDGRYMRTGASFQFGFPVPGFSWTRAFAGYSLSKYRYEAREADSCGAGNLFCQPPATASNVSLAITRDTKNHPLFPTAGTRQNITVEQTGGPLGGDGNFQKVSAETEWWVPLARFGGSGGGRPMLTTLGLKARAGTVFGNASRFPFSRFFLGGTQWGEPLRGYEESTITPSGYYDRDNQSIQSLARLGNAFMTLTAQYALRVNDNISVSLFGDAGNIWSSPSLIDPSRLYRSAGFGATVVTPFGPIGVDVAYGFDKTQPGWQLHFKIQQPGS